MDNNKLADRFKVSRIVTLIGAIAAVVMVGISAYTDYTWSRVVLGGVVVITSVSAVIMASSIQDGISAGLINKQSKVVKVKEPVKKGKKAARERAKARRKEKRQ